MRETKAPAQTAGRSRKERSGLFYFDALARVGPRARKHPASPWSLGSLLAEMDHCSISAALVSSTMAVHYDPMHGNLELISQLKSHKRLFPVWNVMPHQTGEFPEPAGLAKLMQAHDVRAVMLHPAGNAWDLFAAHSHGLLDALQRGLVLTILDRGEFANYADLARLLRSHPSLPLLLTGAHWTEQRYVLPLLANHRNLHLSFDHLQIHYGLEDLVEAGFEDRLLFGTNAPAMSMGAHRCYIDYADVPEQVKRLVAGGNLSRLLGKPELPGIHANKNEDALMAAARQGQPLPVPLIDMHMHILHEGLSGGGGSVRMSHGGPKGVFSQIKRLGCRGGGFMSWNGTVSGDAKGGNACVQAALDVAPPGYWGLASFDPTHYTQRELERMIPDFYRDRRFIGMKPYFSYGIEYHHPSYDVWWKYGNAHGLYAGIHRTRNDFLEIEKLAAKYPRVRWVIYHCGSDYPTADCAIEMMKRFRNVYAEITFTSVTSGIVDYLVAHAGAQRVLYGSDLPMRDPRQQMGWVVFSRLSETEKMKVLAENALRVIRPCLSRLPVHNRPVFSKPKIS